MPKQLNVNLNFTADTGEAKRELQSLQKQLQQLSLNSFGNNALGTYTKEIQQARDAAIDLRNKLMQATNVDTGKLDLSKFSQSLKDSNMDLQKYQKQLAQLGPEGSKAFSAVADSILKAELPLKRTSTLLNNFKTTLMNTFRWQLSSSLLHGLQGAFSTAWGYAKDLNESLNNIQIVTQQSTEQMAQFAVNANKAAHALSATTTAYTDAALIYYQQGLNDKEVKERTDVTVKMANVTGESAQTISEQLTAVWNNFYDGSQSLESFSDKMVALGAATASSSSEISAGLNQFAATANTVGLSFDYAAAALATVTATTRQSANVVGNSFKTLFARLEGLSLGETLEDGTNLNKYSAALEKVGISIKDQNGELKAMDTILDELGSRWQTLAKDQQVALAQTVGGVRQYTQLIALMDNWDFMQENLQTVRGSEGSLQEQADIYEESWKAASKRVQASLEEIYSDLIDDEAFVDVLNFIDKIIQGVDDIIKGVGGLWGILSGLGALATNLFGKELVQGLNNLTYNLNIAKAQEEAIEQKRQAAQSMTSFGGQSSSQEGSAIATAYSERGELQSVYLQNYERLTAEQQQQVQLALDLNAAEGDRIIALGKEVDQLNDTADVEERRLKLMQQNLNNNAKAKNFDLNTFIKDNKDIGEAQGIIDGLQKAFKNGTISVDEYKTKLGEVRDKLEEIKSHDGISDSVTENIEDTVTSIDNLNTALDEGKDNVDEFADELSTRMQDAASSMVDKEYFADFGKPNEEFKQQVWAAGEAAQNAGQKIGQYNEGVQALKTSTKNTADAIKGMEVPLKTTNELIVQSAQGVTSLVFAIKSLTGIIDTINNKDMSFGEKAVAIVGSLAMMIPTLMRAYSSLNGVLVQVIAKRAVSTAGAVAETAATGALTVAKKGETAAVVANTAAWYANPVTWIIAGLMAVFGVITLITNALKKETEEREKNIEKAKEELASQQELTKAYKDQLQTLSQMKNRYDSLGNATDEYVSHLKDLVDQYDIENGYLMLLQKNYEGVENAIYAKYRAELATQRKDTIKSLVLTTGQAYEEGNEAQYARDMLPKYQAQLGVTTFTAEGIIGFSEAAKEQIDILKELNVVKESVYRAADQYGNPEETRWLLDLANFDFTNEEDFNKLKQALAGFKDAAPDTANLTDINILLDSFNDKDFNTAIEYLNDLTSVFKVEDIFIDPRQFKSLKDIHQAFELLQKDGIKEKTILAGISEFLGDLGSEYVGFMQKMSASGITDSNLIQSYLDIFEQLSEEEKTIFLNLKLDPNSKSNITTEIEQWKKEHAVLYIETKMSFASSADELWTENMSTSEINAWLEQFGDLFKESGISPLEFLLQDFDEQKDWLAEQVIALKPKMIQALHEENEELSKRAQFTAITGEAASARQRAMELENQLASLHGGVEIQEKRIEIENELQGIYRDYPEILQNGEYSYAALNDQIEENAALAETEGILWAKNTDSIEELEALAKDGTITLDTFNARASQLNDVFDPDIDMDAYDELFDYLAKNAKDVQGLFKEGQFPVDKKAIEAASKAILRYDSAVQKITDHYEDWVDALDSGNIWEQAEALEEIRNNYSDILDLPFNTLSDEFVNDRKNLELLKEITEGVEGSYEELLIAAEQDIVGHISLDNENFYSVYNDVRDTIAQGLEPLEAEAYLNDAQAIAAMNELINSAELTYSQVMDLLGSMGVDAEVEQVYVPEQHNFVNALPNITTEKVQAPTLINGVLENTDVEVPRIEYDWGTSEATADNTVTAWRIKSARKASGGEIKQNLAPHGGGGGRGKSGGGGGGGSKKTGQATHAKKAPNDKAGDRYHVINNQIEDLAKQYDRLSEAEERAFGKAKLDLMEQQRKKLDEQYKAQRKLRQEAEKYWKEDLDNLKNASIDSDGDGKPDTFGFERFNQDNWYANTHKDDQGNSLGPLNLLLDENGTILNYDQLTAAAYDFYNAKVAEYNQWLDDNYIGKEVDEAIEEEKKQREEGVKQEEGYLNNFLGLVKQYEDTQDKVQEEFNKEIEAYHAELDKMFENTEYAIQIKLDVDEDKLKVLEFLMATLEDNAYRAGEAVANLQNQFAITGDKYENNKSAIEGLFDTHFAADHEFDNDNLDVDNNTFAAKMRGLGLNSGADIVASLMSGNTSLETILGSMGQEFSEQDIKAFREYTEAMMNDAESLLKIRQDMFKQLDDYISQTNDDLDRTRSKIENLSKVTEHWKNLIDLVGRDTAGLDTQEMIDNETESLKVLQAKVAADKDLMDEAEAVLSGLKAEEGKYKEGTNEWNEWKKRVEEAEDRFDEMTENFYSSWEEALQAVKEKFEKTMQWLGEDYSKALGGNAGSLEGLQNLMDQYEKTHSTYVPEFERIYQLNKLNAAAVKAIDETNNIKAKKQLQEYQQQILEAQESGREMSEYELQNLEKELALRQAALALEESRNVKSQVRMQRDNEGNYSYVYTADEDAVADAENNYRDKLYEMQKANYEYINELQNNIVSLQQDYQQAIANAAETYGYGTEAYYDAVDKINSYYDEALKAQYNELNLAMKNNQDLQEFDKNFHAQMTHDKSVSDEGYITSFDQTLYSQLTGYETLEGATQAWSIASANYTSGATTAVNDYKSALEATCIYAGTTLKEQVAEPGGVYYQFGEKAKEAFAKAGKEAYGDGKLDDKNTLMGKVHLMAEQARKDLLGDGGENKGLIGTVGSFVEKTSEYINSLITDTTNLSTAIGNVIEQLSEFGKAKIPEPKTPSGDNNSSSGEDNGSSSTNDSSSNGSSGSSGSDGNKAGPAGPTGPTERKQISKTPTGYRDAKDGSNHFTTYKITYDNGDVEITDPIKEPHTHGAAMSNDALWMCPLCYYTQLKATKEKTVFQEQESWRTEDDGRLRKNTQKRTVSGATGMYTGEWGSEGKLAILHEKELVLNKEDTANMLAAVGMIRQISDVIDLNAKSSGGAFSSLFAANVRNGAQELQQDVHITAEFPNATDHNEILEAFDNVINLASQYANRKVQPAYTSF